MQFTGNTVDRCRGSMINHQGYAGTTTANVFSGNTFDGTTSNISAAPTATTTCITYINVTGSRFDDNLVKSNAGGQLGLPERLERQHVQRRHAGRPARPRRMRISASGWRSARSTTRSPPSDSSAQVPHGTAVFVDGADHTLSRNSTFRDLRQRPGARRPRAHRPSHRQHGAVTCLADSHPPATS